MRNLYAMTLSVAFCLTSALSSAQTHARSVAYDLDIPVEDLTAALQSFAIASHHKLLYRAELTSGKKSPQLKGHFTADEALANLLRGTDLTYEITAGSVVLIKASPQAAGDEGWARMEKPAEQVREAGKQSSQDFRLAQVDQGKASSSVSVASPAANQEISTGASGGVAEIIVTAQKREERLQDVPVPVTAIDAQTLVENNLVRIQDYYTSVPGLSISPSAQGVNAISIRGIAGSANPTVGITVDDVPFGSSTGVGGGAVIPDLDPSDLARVEVLRGPQGTLYGANSMGGLVKFVTLDPSTNAVSGRVQADLDSVRNGAQLGYGFRGSVNVPISDSLAIRASGFARQDPGYIDNVETGQQGINKTLVQGGHLALLWHQSEVFSIKLGALMQHSAADGLPTVDGGLADLQQSVTRGAEPQRSTIQAYSAVVNAKFGTVDLTSISGYNLNKVEAGFDYTDGLGSCCTLPTFHVTGTPLITNWDVKSFTQEVRLSSSIGDRFEWLLGGFYDHINSQEIQYLNAVVPTSGAFVGQWAQTVDPNANLDYAGFADFTLHFSSRFDIQIGGRESWNRQNYQESFIGTPYAEFFLGQPSPVISPLGISRDNAFTYLVTPRFKASTDLMIYARLASGYQPGGPNNIAAAFGLPLSYKPDKTQNYELGIKGAALNGSVTFDGSVYYIDWKDIQLFVSDPATEQGYYANGSRAKSQGVELSVQARLSSALALGAWVAWDEAVLKEPITPSPTLYGAAGDRLPNTPRFSGNLTADEEFPLSDHFTGFAGGTMSYISDRLGVFTASPQRQDLPAYARADLRLGVKYGSSTARVFVNNVTDRRGLLSGGLGQLNPNVFTYVQPRTIGLSVSQSFQ